jgi:GNAT superfamily N-acetyltransferase
MRYSLIEQISTTNITEKDFSCWYKNMMNNVKIEELADSDINEAWNLVQKVYNSFVAPDYSKEGNLKYYELINLEYIRKWKKENRTCLAGKIDLKLIGIIDVRDTFHIAIFFVDADHQNQGIGKELLKSAINKCKAINHNLKLFEVHSSPYAVKIYEKLGFKKRSEEQIQFGIRYTQMEKEI